MKLKYIILLWRGIEVPVIFSPLLPHNAACRGQQAIAAGFVQIGLVDPEFRVVDVTCSGHSESLNLSSRPVEDAALIEEMLANNLCWNEGLADLPR